MWNKKADRPAPAGRSESEWVEVPASPAGPAEYGPLIEPSG